jgi:hypothetical protein
MKRLFIVVLTLLTLTALGRPAAANTGSLSDLPPLSIAIQDRGFEIAASVPAGRYLLSVSNERQTGISISFVAPPTGHSLVETEEALNAQDTVADWLYGTTFIPGPYAAAGGSGQGIVDLPPGDWLVWGGNDIPFAGPVLTVTDEGATGTDASEPRVDVEVSLREYAFVGLESGVHAGSQVWQLTNTGTQPHAFDLIRAPHAMTVEQLMTLMALPDGAVPPPGIPAADEFVQVSGSGAISPGETAWLILPDLSPGTYFTLCFVPDRETGAPHATMGMIQLITIGAE